MPSTPPPCIDEDEAGRESNNSSSASPLSARHDHGGEQHDTDFDNTEEKSDEEENNTMLAMMGGGTRLTPGFGDPHPGDRQTFMDHSSASPSVESTRAGTVATATQYEYYRPSTRPTNTTHQQQEQPTTNHRHVPSSRFDSTATSTSLLQLHAPYNHVVNRDSEQKNDITSDNAAEVESGDEKSEKEEKHAPARIPAIPSHEGVTGRGAESDSGETSALTTNQPLSSEHLKASLEAAVASVASVAISTHSPPSKVDGKKNDDQVDVKMSVNKLVPSKKARRKRSPQVKPGQSTGRWTHAEHRAFLDGLKECGREWKKVAMRIPTRTSAQIRSHAQKYFAKLQREQETMVLPDNGVQGFPQMGVGAAAAAASSATAIPSDAHPLRPAVQQNVERILANPQAAQREVENTLEALRERYRQLQIRLHQRQQRRGDSSSQSRLVEDDSTYSSSSNRKRTMNESRASDRESFMANDDHSSVASTVSASVASMASSVVAGRDLGDEELIALHVLGETLQRGDSTSDEQLASNPSVPANGQRDGAGSSDSSTSTSTTATTAVAASSSAVPFNENIEAEDVEMEDSFADDDEDYQDETSNLKRQRN